MKNPRKNEPALSDMLLKLRFAEKKHANPGFFSARSANFSRMLAGPLCAAGFRRKFNTDFQKSDSLLGETIMRWDDQVVLVTGGTGSFGNKFTEIILKEYLPRRS